MEGPVGGHHVGPFSLRPVGRGDKLLYVDGPGDLMVMVDFDDVPESVLGETQKMVRLLNERWTDKKLFIVHVWLARLFFFRRHEVYVVWAPSQRAALTEVYNQNYPHNLILDKRVFELPARHEEAVRVASFMTLEEQ